MQKPSGQPTPTDRFTEHSRPWHRVAMVGILLLAAFLDRDLNGVAV